MTKKIQNGEWKDQIHLEKIETDDNFALITDISGFHYFFWDHRFIVENDYRMHEQTGKFIRQHDKCIRQM